MIFGHIIFHLNRDWMRCFQLNRALVRLERGQSTNLDKIERRPRARKDAEARSD